MPALYVITLSLFGMLIVACEERRPRNLASFVKKGKAVSFPEPDRIVRFEWWRRGDLEWRTLPAAHGRDVLRSLKGMREFLWTGGGTAPSLPSCGDLLVRMTGADGREYVIGLPESPEALASFVVYPPDSDFVDTGGYFILDPVHEARVSEAVHRFPGFDEGAADTGNVNSGSRPEMPTAIDKGNDEPPPSTGD